MGNRATIEPCEFKNVRTGESTFGVRVYDDYGMSYDNTWDSIPDCDMEVISKVVSCLHSLAADEVVRGIIDHAIENENPIIVGGEVYEYDEYSHLTE